MFKGLATANEVKVNNNNKFKSLADYIKKAKGYRTVDRFAGDCGIFNEEWIQLIVDVINEKINSFPNKVFLQLLAEGSEGRVTYSELRTICGYPDDNEKLIDFKNIIVKRGEIYIVYFGNDVVGSECAGLRPALVVSNEKNNIHSNTINIIPITTKSNTVKYQEQEKKLPTHVFLGRESGLDRESEAQAEQVTTKSKLRLLYNGQVRKIGVVPDDRLKKVAPAAMIQLGLIEPYFNYKEADRLCMALYGTYNALKFFHRLYSKTQNIDALKRINELEVTLDVVKEDLNEYCWYYDRDWEDVYNEFKMREKLINVTNKVNNKREYAYA